MLTEKGENLNQPEKRKKDLSQAWQNIKELLLSPATPDMIIQSSSYFPGIKRLLDDLGEPARNILEQEIGPQEIDQAKKNMYDQIEEICASKISPAKKIERIRYYMKELAIRLGLGIELIN